MHDEKLDEKLEFLRNFGCKQLKHSAGDLLEHLLGTYELLVSWGVRETVCDAGLFHSVYGTESYIITAIPLNMRNRVSEVIGKEAEELAFFFSMMKRESFYENLFRSSIDMNFRSFLTGEKHFLKKQQFIDLCHIILANWLEQRPRVSPEYHYMRRKEFEAMRPLLLKKAADQLDKACKISTE